MKHSEYVTVKPGTAVTRKILDNLGSPDEALKIIHIAGSNGKGSTAEFFTQILIAAGKRVGTFTSPAVYDFYEQFRIDGKAMPEELAEKYFERAQSASEGLSPTDFELQTAGVLLAFKEEGCEYAVIECGMGGLNDATNAINRKELAVITSVTCEHIDYLGADIAGICAHKAGIIKNCPVVVNALQTDEVKKYFADLGATFACRFTDNAQSDNVSGDKTSNEFWYAGRQYELSTYKYAQMYNAATAIEGAEILGIEQEAIFEGLRRALPLGRLEVIERGGKTYVLDGAHNPQAFEPLRAYLNGSSVNSDNDPVQRAKRFMRANDVTVIYGCLKDKNVHGNLRCLEGLARQIIAVECPSLRTVGLEDTAMACKLHFPRVDVAESVSEALAKADTKTVVICGSFTILKEAKKWIEKGQ